MHAHYDDVLVVIEGTATLVTGGAVLDAKTGEDGETKGSRHSEWNLAHACQR